MEFSTVLAAGIIMTFIMVISMVCSILLILLVLIQKGKGGGLSSAFGGGGGGGLLGSKTGDVLTWVTVSLAALFLFLMVIMAKFYKPTVIETMAPQMQTLPMGQNQQPTQQTMPVTPFENAPATNPEQTPAPEDADGSAK